MRFQIMKKTFFDEFEVAQDDFIDKPQEFQSRMERETYLLELYKVHKD